MKKTAIYLLLQLLAFNLSSQCGNGEIVRLVSQTEVNSFIDDYCIDFEGTLQIIDNNDGQDNIVSLEALLSLTTIGAVFQISDNSLLESLSGLDSISYIGALRIINNPLLNDLQGLDSLTTLTGDLIIKQNKALLNLEGLSSLTTIQSIGGYIEISDNSSLNDLSALSALTSTIGGLIVTGNGMLTSLNGLQNLKIDTDSDSPIVEDIEIYDNELLSDCAIKSICDALSKTGITFDINNNEMDCNSDDEILSICVVSTSNIISKVLSIYPNPVGNQITIQSNEKGELIVINSIGAIIMKTNIEEGINNIEFSNTESGFYIFHTSMGTAERIVKL